MRRETFAETLRQITHAVPFRPFTVELLNGERLLGHHPELFTLVGDLVLYEEPIGEDESVTTYFDASSVARIINVVIPLGKH